MKLENWFGTAVALFFLFGALAPSYRHSATAFDFPPTNDGDTLTDDQKTAVQGAIDAIGLTDKVIGWEDVNGNHHSAKTDSIARCLQNELNNNQIQQEVQNNDFAGWEYQGGINLNDDWLNGVVDGSVDGRHLEEILVHEWIHKTQDGTAQRFRCEQCAKEVEANDGEMAYKDSVGIPRSNEMYKKAWYYWYGSYCSYWNWRRGDLLGVWTDSTLVVEVRPDSGGGPDQCLCYHSNDTTASVFDLDFRCSDFRVLENYFPNGRGVVLTCGSVPGMGGRIQALELSVNGVVGITMTQDFPDFFYTMEHAEFDNSWMIVDTAARVIHRLEDSNGDLLPDLPTGDFAAEFQFPELEGMRSLQAGLHPLHGIGLIVNPEPAREKHLIEPYDLRWFLVDADGDHVADACHLTRRCEFIQVRPQFRATAYAGDQSARVFGTWLHDIAVFTCDESGEILMEFLGAVNLADSITATCLLARPLESGEYIIPVDMMNGQRSGQPRLVDVLAPEHLVIQVGPGGGVLFLSWDPVPGAVDYAIWMSEDGTEFLDSGMRTPVPEFAIPLMGNKYFFQVRAIR